MVAFLAVVVVAFLAVLVFAAALPLADDVFGADFDLVDAALPVLLPLPDEDDVVVLPTLPFLLTLPFLPILPFFYYRQHADIY